MKKYQLMVVFFIAVALVLSACSHMKQKNQTIKYERRFGKYFDDGNSQQKGNTIDLSEGPKLRYDAKFGPRDLNFDIKIENPYSY